MKKYRDSAEKAALKVVLELAEQNAYDADNDHDDALKAEASRQAKAIGVVRRLLRRMY